MTVIELGFTPKELRLTAQGCPRSGLPWEYETQ